MTPTSAARSPARRSWTAAPRSSSRRTRSAWASTRPTCARSSHWALPTSLEAYYQEAGRGGRDGGPARALLLRRADLGRLISFIKRDARRARGRARLRRSAADGRRAWSSADRRVERRAWSRLSWDRRARRPVLAGTGARGSAVRDPARRWRRSGARGVDLSPGPGPGVARLPRGRGVLLGVRQVPAPVPARALLRPASAGPIGRCCDVCDPDTIDLPDPSSLTPARRAKRSKRAEAPEPPTVDPANAGLLNALREWRLGAAEGKPAYTVAHNRTLETIAELRPVSLDQLARIKGVGPMSSSAMGQKCSRWSTARESSSAIRWKQGERTSLQREDDSKVALVEGQDSPGVELPSQHRDREVRQA